MSRQFKKYIVSVKTNKSIVGGATVQASCAVKAMELFYIDNKNLIPPHKIPYLFKVVNEDGLELKIRAKVGEV